MNLHDILFGNGSMERGFSATAFVLDTAAKVAVLLVLAGLMTLILRKRTAATVHRVWVLAFFGCLATPLVTLIAPAWSLPILPESTPEDVAPRSGVIATAIPAPIPLSPPAAAGGLEAALPSPSTPAPSYEPPGLTKRATTPAPEIRPPREEPASGANDDWWSFAAIAVWLGGVLACLGIAIRQRVLLRRLLRRSEPIAEESWTRTAADVSRSLEFDRPLRLRRVSDLRSPMLAGILQPTILLPGDAAEWSLDRRRLVLLHEAAHAKRRDVFTQTIASLVCALHWFNPLAWYGLARMRQLRELACDDLVVARSRQPADYAEVLLDVAKSYRHRSLHMAVGMARCSNVERRIRAVLDRARSRAALSRGMAGVLLVCAAVVVTTVAPIQFESVASSPKIAASDAVEAEEDAAPPAETEAPSSSDELTQAEPEPLTIEVRVLDEEGQPLPGSKVRVSIWELERTGKFPTTEYPTDADGIARVKRPRGLRILRLWAKRPGHVSEFVNFAQGSHEEGRLIPDQYEFRLARGTRLSGVVVDETGRPIAGANVKVRVDVRQPRWGVNPEPTIDTWISSGGVLTDKAGRWHVDNAPAPRSPNDFPFRLRVTHSDHVGDSEWGQLQKQQGVGSDALRDGTAKIVVPSGVSVRGTIVDSKGNPVTKGSVIWGTEPHGDASRFEAKLDDAGRFQTKPLLLGEHPFTIIAPGFRPERRTLSVSRTMEDVRMQLVPGKRLAIKVVDTEGQPVPGARVFVGSWRGVEPPFRGGGSSILQSRVPGSGGDDGVYRWDWAPPDAVTYVISARGYASVTATLIPTKEGHVVTLPPELVASGRVTDAKTGEPIEHFRVIPVTEYRPKFLNTRFPDTLMGSEGSYRIRLVQPGQRNYRYRVRIEADGYRSFVSPTSYGEQDGHVACDVALEPAPAREGRVVDQEGKAVADATVVLASPTMLPAMNNLQVDRGGPLVRSSPGGKFSFAATAEPVRIRVIHEKGFADVRREPGDPAGTIALQSWARVSGRLVQDGHPVRDQMVYFHVLPRGELGEPRFQETYTATTNAEGRFDFARLPPISGNVRAYLGPWQDSPLTSSRSLPLSLRPGEHRELVLGGEGVSITGQVVATGREAHLNRNWSLNYLISRDREIPAPKGMPRTSFDPSQPVQTSWFLDPNHHEWLRTRENYFVKLTPDGEFTISGVRPGRYDLIFQLYEQPAGCLVESVGARVIAVEVTERDEAAGVKPLGTIEVACRAGPRPGEDMRVYRFDDSTGRERTIGDMTGRFVVLHAWASWCAPCLTSLPDIKATHDRLSGRPVTFVGLNLDKNAADGKALARQGGWNWSQNYLGDESDMARQLAISSLPTYFLIGTDGTLITAANDWKEIEARLESELDISK